MKISAETLAILKNFKTINQSIVLKPGNAIKTLSNQMNILGVADIAENLVIEDRVSIYDLGQLLSSIDLVEDPDLSFEASKLVISNDRIAINYRYSDPSLNIKTPPDGDVSIGSEDVFFVLRNDDFQSLVKASSVLGLPDLVLVGDGESIRLQLGERKAGTCSNNYSVVLGETFEEFTFHFQMKNLRLLSGDYDVFVSKTTNRSRFEHHSLPVKYFIALEAA